MAKESLSVSLFLLFVFLVCAPHCGCINVSKTHGPNIGRIYASIKRTRLDSGVEVLSFIPERSTISSSQSFGNQEIIFLPSPVSVDETFTAECVSDDDSFCSLLNENGFIVHVISILPSQLPPILTSIPKFYQTIFSETLSWRRKEGVDISKMTVIAHELSSLYVLSYLGSHLLSTCCLTQATYSFDPTLSPASIPAMLIGCLIVINPPDILSLINNDGNSILQKYMRAMTCSKQYNKYRSGGGDNSRCSRGEGKFLRFVERVNANAHLRAVFSGSKSETDFIEEVSNSQDLSHSDKKDWEEEVELIAQCVDEWNVRDSVPLQTQHRKKKKYIMNAIPLSDLSSLSKKTIVDMNLQTLQGGEKVLKKGQMKIKKEKEKEKKMDDTQLATISHSSFPPSHLLGSFPPGLALIREVMKGKIMTISTFLRQVEKNNYYNEDSATEICALIGGKIVEARGGNEWKDSLEEKERHRTVDEDDIWGEQDKKIHRFVAAQVTAHINTF